MKILTLALMLTCLVLSSALYGRERCSAVLDFKDGYNIKYRKLAARILTKKGYTVVQNVADANIKLEVMIGDGWEWDYSVIKKIRKTMLLMVSRRIDNYKNHYNDDHMYWDSGAETTERSFAGLLGKRHSFKFLLNRLPDCKNLDFYQQLK